MIISTFHGNKFHHHEISLFFCKTYPTAEVQRQHSCYEFLQKTNESKKKISNLCETVFTKKITRDDKAYKIIIKKKMGKVYRIRKKVEVGYLGVFDVCVLMNAGHALRMQITIRAT